MGGEKNEVFAAFYFFLSLWALRVFQVEDEMNVFTKFWVEDIKWKNYLISKSYIFRLSIFTSWLHVQIAPKLLRT